MATHSSILAWRMPRTEEPNRPKSLGSQTKSPTRLSDGTAATAVLASPRCYFLCPQSSVFPYLHSFGFFRAGAGGGGTLSLSSHMLQHSPPPTILFIFLAASHGMQDISSPTRYQIHAPPALGARNFNHWITRKVTNFLTYWAFKIFCWRIWSPCVIYSDVIDWRKSKETWYVKL